MWCTEFDCFFSTAKVIKIPEKKQSKVFFTFDAFCMFVFSISQLNSDSIGCLTFARLWLFLSVEMVILETI